MAELHAHLKGNFDSILADLDNAVTGKSLTAKLEDSSYYKRDNVRCAVKVYERYSYLGKNRVSLSITLLQADEDIFISAITSGGSQAVFFKFNTFGEEAFLDTIRNTINTYIRFGEV